MSKFGGRAHDEIGEGTRVKFKVPVIIYDRGRAEEIDILQENFSRPTRPADKTFCSPLNIAR